jgi:GntR family carbon starvation induced transcriptional regulator
LRGDILRGVLAPGAKLRTESLRERYGVGNSPIREALNRLSVDGLVTREDQKGFRVATVSRADLEELIKTRCWLEEIALRESIARGGEAWEEAVVLAFHRLSRARRSAWLLQYCAQLNDQADRYRQLAIGVAYPGRNELSEHVAIKDAALAGDADAAVAALRAHYERTAGIIRDSFPDLPAGEND